MVKRKRWYTKLIGSLLLGICLSLFGGNLVQAKVVNEPKIILDLAHRDTENDKGATYKEWNERDIVNQITLKVGDKLVNKGFTVTYTRELDKSTSISNRINLANSSDYWLYLSIHANSNDSAKPGTGVEAFSNNEWSLSNNILNDLSEEFGLTKRNSPQATPFYNRKISNSTLLEIGFINNDFDRSIMLDYQDKIADIIANNIESDYNLKMQETNEGLANQETKTMKMYDGSEVPVKITYY
jgi:N-acetylmuramoyl-L-alanine amidase